MTNDPVELIVFDGSKSIFDRGVRYEIPLYQRAYAWGEKQLVELIDDISDVKATNYFIGSLIVSKNKECFEVVDGQQRLTSLFLLLNCLGVSVSNNLHFACRDKSNYTLEHIKYLYKENESLLDDEKIEENIRNGIKIIQDKLEVSKINSKDLLEKLKRVVLYRIEVPKNTDLNHYFEIMNTRGEQLELQDILKANLMSFLDSDHDKSIFASIWDACSDMTGYVQMHFKNNARDIIFKNEWGLCPTLDWFSYEKIVQDDGNTEKTKLTDIIKDNFKVRKIDGETESGDRTRFESVIEFPYFLMHVLKVYLHLNPLSCNTLNESIVAELLDDKKLIVEFDKVINKLESTSEKSAFAKTFAMCLLRSRYLFDKYILKREFVNDSEDGEWSLKELHVSGQQTKRKPYYKNTRLVKQNEWERTNDSHSQTNVMIQSALRVSYTSPKVMHWITKLLIWLSENDCKHLDRSQATCKLPEYSGIVEKIAKEAVRKDFFDECSEGKYEMGVNTPHIVFNYLDFLLWKENTEKYKDFIFEFRNSVEHWYPQNPSDGMFDKWPQDAGVNRFGNLCLIQRNINSKFSNNAPDAKKSSFEKMINKGSLKLRLMRDLTKDESKDGDIRKGSYVWRYSTCEQHECDMIKILKVACDIV